MRDATMVAIPRDYSGRYSWFDASINDLDLPEGSSIKTFYGHRIGSVRNELVEAFLQGDWQYLFFVDDDEVIPADAVRRLLGHRCLVVSGLCLQRSKPFLPTAYVTMTNGKYQPLDLQSIGGDRLVPCAGLGTGALLVHRDVFLKIDPPWFKYSEELGEDLYFSRLCAKAGIAMYLDTGCRVGHIIPAAIVPAMHEGRWLMGLQLAEGTTTAIELEHRK